MARHKLSNPNYTKPYMHPNSYKKGFPGTLAVSMADWVRHPRRKLLQTETCSDSDIDHESTTANAVILVS